MRDLRRDSPFREILLNRIDGASALFRQFVERARDQTDEDILNGLYACQRTFPSMAVWTNALVLYKQDKYRLDDIAHRFHQQTLDTITTGAYILEEYRLVLTLSNSSVIRQAIISAQSPLKVLCAKSLPGGEGAHQANALRSSGIESELVDDNDLSKHVLEVEAVVLGADYWSQNSFINKVGSKNIIDLADVVGIPAMVMAEGFKNNENMTDLASSLYQVIRTSDGKTTQEPVFEIITWRPHIKLISNTTISSPSADQSPKQEALISR